MKQRIMFVLIISLILVLWIGIVNSKVVKEQATQQQQQGEFEIVKKGEAPHITIFYFGELQGFLTPCG